MLSDPNIFLIMLMVSIFALALYGVGRVLITWLDRRQAMHEINVYVDMINAVTTEAKEAGIKISQDDVKGMRDAFDDMCPMAVKLGMHITRFVIKDQ